MSRNILQAQVQQVVPTEGQDKHSTYELRMFWRIRWFFAILIGGVYAFSAIAGILGFLLTNTPALLALVAAPNILMPAIIYLVPMDERRYQLKALKFQAKVQKLVAKRFNGVTLPKT